MRALVMRFDAPLVSFGSVLVDQHGFIDLFPGTSMLTGLVANALGDCSVSC
ncbi:type I-E CRISPR-associated protein Cas5/CasD [Geochorda subterranea]|uniref:Type I-E CRISPR-associated protein Cas5/CasD n=1 Tax=Geochorda subterranea TaxID=3109564 RepID=A0ABZ1BQQ1_9FIRM|nr:type I-E CRISPR-associated protein Cas5/CasD [Limnochorda sp. LNt]WRP14978.1 type I-E CRISPR-associated protein Cas5/CasD [Limnochorda sp. LNt]